MKLKNKKGFTLIELLAVIVVLAIIALIATPIVMNTIKSAKKGAAERSADNYLKQVEQAVAESRIDGTKILDGIYNIQPDGNLCPTTGCGENDKDKITIEMSGNKPTSGKIIIKNSGVDKDKSDVKIDNYIVSYDKDNNKQQAQEIYKGILCKAVTTATTGNIPQGQFAYGDEYTCELGDNDEKTFFVLETNGDDVSLIMNANVDSNGKAITSSNIPNDKGTVAWVTKEDYLAAGGTEADWGNDGNNNLGPLTAEKILKSNTKGWTKLNLSQITLPSASQVAIASGKTFDGHSVIGLSQWLYDYLDETTNPVPALVGYWTDTHEIDVSINALHIMSYGYIVFNNVKVSYGIRPVITISKSNLS